MTATKCRLGSTYRISVPWYSLADGTTLTDLDAAPTLQAYDSTGATTVGAASTCTKASTGVYYGDLELAASTFAAGTYIWKMSGHSGTKDVNQSGEISVLQVV